MNIGIFSLIGWSFLDQRPQMFARHLASQGHNIHYISPFNDFDEWSDRSLHNWDEYQKKCHTHRSVQKNITTHEFVFVPLYKCFKGIQNLNKIFFHWAKKEIKKMNLDAAIVIDPVWGKSLKEIKVPFIYDHVDDTHLMDHILHDEFYKETLFCEKNSVVNLFIQKYIAEKRNGVYIPNGVNLRDIIERKGAEKLYDAVCLSCIDLWFDFQSVIDSNKRVLLIGPMDPSNHEIYSEYCKNNEQKIQWIPRLNRSVAMQWMNMARVGIIPFKEEHPLVDYVMPLKIVEYFALGLPGVCYGNLGVEDEFQDLAHYYSPSGWRGHPELGQAIEMAMVDQREKERKEKAKEFTWDRVLKPLDEVIGGL